MWAMDGKPPISFFPFTSTNLEISHQNFLSFSFKNFCQIIVKFLGHTQNQYQIIIGLRPRAPVKKKNAFYG